jgi:glycerol-3-phosphate dehydrogenase
VVFAYAGIRPLPWSGASSTGAISRDHAFKVFGAGEDRAFSVMTLVGGKWTTYRACAEDNCKVLLTHLGKAHRRSTLELPVGGSAGLPKDEAGLKAFAAGVARQAGIDDQVASSLVRRYGSRAAEVAAEVARSPRVMAGNPAYHEGEIRWIIRNERVTRLADIILRRTLLPFEDGLSRDLVRAIGQITAAELGWSEERLQHEMQAATAMLVGRYRVSSLSGA